jgi:hypothetical protein
VRYEQAEHANPGKGLKPLLGTLSEPVKMHDHGGYQYGSTAAFLSDRAARRNRRRKGESVGLEATSHPRKVSLVGNSPMITRCQRWLPVVNGLYGVPTIETCWSEPNGVCGNSSTISRARAPAHASEVRSTGPALCGALRPMAKGSRVWQRHCRPCTPLPRGRALAPCRLTVAALELSATATAGTHTAGDGGDGRFPVAAPVAEALAGACRIPRRSQAEGGHHS